MISPYENLFIKLVDVIQQGFVGLAQPTQIKRIARAQATANVEAMKIERLGQERLRVDLQAIQRGEKTINEFLQIEDASNGKLLTEDQEIERVKDQYLRALGDSGYKPDQLISAERQINLHQIALLTLEEAAEEMDQKPDDTPVDPDWFAQWRNRAQDVSNEAMQRLWAKVLKGEAREAKSFSIHTMDFLSRMTRSDAELIARMGVYAIDGSLLPTINNATTDLGLSFDELLYLEDLGIVSGVQGFGITKTMRFVEGGSARIVIVRNNNKGLVFFAADDTVDAIEIIGHSISVIGRELLTLASVEADLEFLKKFAAAHKAKAKQISLLKVTGFDKETGDTIYSVEEELYRTDGEKAPPA